MAKVVNVDLLKGKVNYQLEKTILEYFICNVQHQGTKSGFFSVQLMRKES